MSKKLLQLTSSQLMNSDSMSALPRNSIMVDTFIARDTFSSRRLPPLAW
ncbi:hypothetical protein [Thiolapillus sp.]